MVNRTTSESNGNKFIRAFASYSGCSEASIENHVLAYNNDFTAYGNEVYKDIGSRIAHWYNFLEQGWFQHRLDFPLRMIPNYDLVVDLGFSVPYALSLKHLRDLNSTRYLFVDQFYSALEFFNSLEAVEGWGNRQAHCEILVDDITKRSTQEKIAGEIRDYSPRSTLIVLSEVLEHLRRPEKILDWILEDLIIESSNTTLFLTLPVGDIIPSHTIGFSNSLHVHDWLMPLIGQHSSYLIRPATVASSKYLREVYCAVCDFAVAR